MRVRRPTLAETRKAIAAASGAAAVLAAQGLLTGPVENWTTGLLAAATAALVWWVPNSPPQVAEPR